jgi:hypothetical protein
LYVLFLALLFCTYKSQIPQLWSACLPQSIDDNILHHRVNTIRKLEEEKDSQADRKAEHKKALDAAKKQGKEVYEAEKARISQEKLALVEAKKQEKLQTSVAKQAEKARLAAAKKVKAAQLKVARSFPYYILNVIILSMYSVLGFQEMQISGR